MSKVVFIAGMHRSGTSMVARLLHHCGIYLGSENDLKVPQPDNLEGYWENAQFRLLNDEILSELNGGWDFTPKVDSGWEKSYKFLNIRSEASELIKQFSSHDQWGWKDPRNSLTFPFWNELIPLMKVVICVRSPLEVANSLLKRNYLSPALAFNLWLEYNQKILSHSEPENRIITHYDSYFRDPYMELTRVLKFLEMEIPEKHIMKVIEMVDIGLHHNQSTIVDLLVEAPAQVINLYQEMCNQTEEVFQLLPDTDIEFRTHFDKYLQSDDTDKDIKLLSIKLQNAKKNY